MKSCSNCKYSDTPAEDKPCRYCSASGGRIRLFSMWKPQTEVDKLDFDPILTDGEIEFIWNAIDRQYPIKAFKDELTSTFFRCGNCRTTVAKLDEYCWFCGQKLDWED